MPLPAPQPRRPLHHRKVFYDGYLRDDGLWDIEARMTDVKAYDFSTPHRGDMPAGTPIHDMYIRATVDDAMRIVEITAVMDARPFPECPKAEDPLQKLVGATMGQGWRYTIEKAMSGVQGCTHLRELLVNMGTAAFQTIPVYQSFLSKEGTIPGAAKGLPPPHLGKCLGWDFNGPAVQRLYPQFVGFQPAAKTKTPEKT
ncbi:MAG: DUF2889 domain-containing protein [Pseudomonadota bacterium]